MNASKGALVLFQYDCKIIASAVFNSQERYGKPQDGYHGALLFDVTSIRAFDPVKAWVLREIWPNDFKRFTNVKTQLDPVGLDAFERRLTNIRTPEPRVQANTPA